MAKQATELRYAVRFRVVFKYFGNIVPGSRRADDGASGDVADLRREVHHPEIFRCGLRAHRLGIGNRPAAGSFQCADQ